MRSILRKLYRGQDLNDEEYTSLTGYADELRANLPYSYQLFYERFAPILHRDYRVHLPRFYFGIDDVYDYLLSHPELIARLRTEPLDTALFPDHLHEYLLSDEGENALYTSLLPALEHMEHGRLENNEVPRPRLTDAVVKFESGNPLKETGLKAHFDRLIAFPFVSRLQSVRYLRGTKASQDKIEVITGDCLGGIFTNKEKSIYYYIFLTEDERSKAENACRLLNRTLYGLSGEE